MERARGGGGQAPRKRNSALDLFRFFSLFSFVFFISFSFHFVRKNAVQGTRTSGEEGAVKKGPASKGGVLLEQKKLKRRKDQGRLPKNFLQKNSFIFKTPTRRPTTRRAPTTPPARTARRGPRPRPASRRCRPRTPPRRSRSSPPAAPRARSASTGGRRLRRFCSSSSSRSSRSSSS